MIKRSENSVHLEKGMYELCRMRIATDEEFRAQAENRNFENVDAALFDEYRIWQIKKNLKRVYENSSFYKRLFDRHGVKPEDFEKLEDLSKFPFTFPVDLSGTSYSLLCTSQSQVEKPVTFYTSGSTGTKKRIFFSKADIQKILDFLPRGMNTVIGKEEGRCLVFLQNSQGRGIGGILAQSLNMFGMKGWAADLQDSTEDILKATIENKVNVWFGEALTILRATRILSQTTDLSKLGMKCIFITMTNIPQSMIDYLEKTWNCHVSTHYGLTESGWGLAVDCDVCPGYHYDEMDHFLEVVHPETGEVLPYGTEGEVVLTNIARDCMPLIRYRTGDIATLYKSECGSHLDVLSHIVRRKEGAYKLNGKDIFPAIFDQAIFEMPDTLDYRIFVEDDRFYFDMEVLDTDKFDSKKLIEKFMALPQLQGEKEPVINALPSGALRKFCFEKKRIRPLSEREL